MNKMNKIKYKNKALYVISFVFACILFGILPRILFGIILFGSLFLFYLLISYFNFWKVVFCFSLLYLVTGLCGAFLHGHKAFFWIFFSAYAVDVLAGYGLAYQKKILNEIYWRVWSCLNFAVLAFLPPDDHNLIVTRKLILFIVIGFCTCIIPIIVAMFKYAWFSKNIWKANKPSRFYVSEL